MKHAVEDLADGLPGVKDVDNKLRVSQGDRPSESSDTGARGGNSARDSGSFGGSSSGSGASGKSKKD
jgi:hypothetical protein